MFFVVSGEDNHEQLLQRVRGMVEAELQRLGRKVTLRVEGQWLVVGKGGDEARADLGGTLAQWDNLPDDLRERRVRQIAELLAQASGRKPLSVRPKRQRPPAGMGWLAKIKPIFIALIMIGVLGVAFRYLSPHGATYLARVDGLLHALPSASAIAPKLLNPEPERAVIASAACGAAQTRVARGAVVGPSDTEGWQVELVLLRRGPHVDLGASPALAQFVRRKPGATSGTFIWPGASSLVESERFDAQVLVQTLPDLGDKHLSGLSLVFSGPYVSPYFSEDLRSDYFKLADALASALGATEGGLFARCANADVHQIGAWFLGANPGAAVASLIYFMASFADPPVLKPEVVGSRTDPRRHDHAFDVISLAANELDRGAVASLLGGELGMISGRPGKPSHLTFPFRDANRATRASVAVAGALRLASAR